MKQLFILFLFCVLSSGGYAQSYRERREAMVSRQIEARGITHQPTLEAMRKVERHLFVPSGYREDAYRDTPLPIGRGQTISQPYMVALMTSLLAPQGDDRILEIGTGSGYQAAVLAEIVREVYTIEIVPELGESARETLAGLGYHQVTVVVGDGYRGLPEKAPFDGIIVTAAPETIPPPLLAQLKEGGRMVIPVGPPGAVQSLLLIEKKNGKIRKTRKEHVRFVPFTRSAD